VDSSVNATALATNVVIATWIDTTASAIVSDTVHAASLLMLLSAGLLMVLVLLM